jgi:murein DD-endopeptidase MepM/ murein hydrolase activator NlpD
MAPRWLEPLLQFDRGRILEYYRSNRFTVISWGTTALMVVVLLGFGLAKNASKEAATSSVPTAVPGHEPSVSLPVPPTPSGATAGVGRQLQLKTNIPDRPRYDPVTYRVTRGDAMFSIAKSFSIKPESILYTNKDVLEDNPHNLKPGMDLIIPPVDGLYYTWKDGDTVEAVAEQFKANPDDILGFPGNKIDLTDPTIKPGTLVMIPGGQRELVDWTKFIPTISRNPGGGTGTSEIGGHACSGGPVGSGFIWPTSGPHTLSGNDYGPGHLGIDISATEGTPVLSASAGVVVIAQGGYNYGYGNFVEIDHGNGYATIYAHLSQINVSVCQGVAAGELVGLAGSTGNSTGSHLHFEVRKGGTNINPWFVVQ